MEQYVDEFGDTRVILPGWRVDPDRPTRAEIKAPHIRGYMLPSKVRRFLRTRLEAYANRPRMMMAVTKLATIIGQYQCGPQNFVGRGCGIGGEGAGFFLARQGLVREFGDRNFTEALIREATRFLINIGFIERLSPEGELIRVKRPKNAVDCHEDGYFRTAVKAKKDSLGRIRAPLTYYRLGSRIRSLFSETMRPDRITDVEKLKEPVCENTSKSTSPYAVSNRESVHTGCAPYDVCGHDPKDPRFDYYRPDPMKDPHHGVRTIGRRNLGPWGLPSDRPQFSPAVQTGQRAAYLAMLEERRVMAKPKLTLSAAALAIFNKPMKRL